MNNRENVNLFFVVSLVFILIVNISLFVFGGANKIVSNNQELNIEAIGLSNSTKTIFVCGAVKEEKEITVPVNFTYAQLVSKLQQEDNWLFLSRFDVIYINQVISRSDKYIVINYGSSSPVNIIYASLEQYFNLGIDEEIANKIIGFAYHNYTINNEFNLVNSCVLSENEFNQIKHLIYAYVMVIV